MSENKVEENRTNLLNLLGIEKWLELNAQLNKKKNLARKELVKMGVLEKKGNNKFDNYKYFTEAQYKDVANKILTNAGLELKTTEEDYNSYQVPNSKTPEGRTVKVLYTLTDIATGFYEESIISGEGLDRGDKAGYKAYTGAVKYYLANTFLVPTGDDAEKEDTDGGKRKNVTKKKMPNKDKLMAFCKENNIDLNDVATQYHLTSKSTDDDFFDVLCELMPPEEDNASNS